MIVTRAPLRLSLGGGGTDLPSYYSEYESEFIAGAIDKYVYMAVNRPAILDAVLVKYSISEQAASASGVKHDLVREALMFYGIDSNIEISSMADIPSGTGMGSSGSYIVALVAALRQLQNMSSTTLELASEACHIEIDRANHPVGMQDQLVAAFGGIRHYRIARDGTVSTEPIRLHSSTLSALERRLQLWFTGITRQSSTILADQQHQTLHRNPGVVNNLHHTKELGRLIHSALVAGDLDHFGTLLDEHWQNKKQRSSLMSDDDIDHIYNLARRSGALGGKVVGAGGGGFLMLLAAEGAETRLATTISGQGMREMPFRFVKNGVEVLLSQ